MTNPLFDALFAPNIGSERPFLILADRSQISYAAFLRQAAQMANALTSLGLVAGDRVAVQVEKSPQALALYAACVQSGLVFLPLNTGYTTHELSYFLENSGASLLVCGGAQEAELSSLAPRVLTLEGDGSGSLVDLSARQQKVFDTVPREANDLAALLYTSGTTGRSK
ncbi:MAG: AMP-binding protein, partial [Litoreibacter sp.]|nr:AMP-binding protein [Litoreibacter sp.]